jgi:hypothetical protein
MPFDEPKTVNEEIDHSIDESFPASDPPSWSKGKRHKSDLPLGDDSPDQVKQPEKPQQERAESDRSG